MELAQAQQIGHTICELLDPAALDGRIKLAGSIRRRKPVVKDVEIVLASRFERARSMFGDDEQQEIASAAAWNRVAELAGDKSCPLSLDVALPRNGKRYKRLRWTLWAGSSVVASIAVDLFIVLPPSEWGVQLAIRTGPADFSRLLVTPRAHGGALPNGMQVRDGSVWDGDTKLSTPTEESFFRLLGVPAWKPAERTAERLLNYLGHRRSNHAGTIA